MTGHRQLHSTCKAESSRCACLPLPSLASTSQSCLKHAFRTSTDGTSLHTRSDGNLVQIESNDREVVIRDTLFANDAAVTALGEQHLQNLMNCISPACEDFRLAMSLKRTDIMSPDTESLPAISPYTTTSWMW